MYNLGKERSRSLRRRIWLVGNPNKASGTRKVVFGLSWHRLIAQSVVSSASSSSNESQHLASLIPSTPLTPQPTHKPPLVLVHALIFLFIIVRLDVLGVVVT